MALSSGNSSVNGIFDFIREGDDILTCLKQQGASDVDLMTISDALKTKSHDAFHKALDSFLSIANKPGGCLYQKGTRVGVPPSCHTKEDMYSVNFGRYTADWWQVESLSIHLDNDRLSIEYNNRTVSKSYSNGTIIFENGDTFNGRLIHKDTSKPNIAPYKAESESHYYAYDQHVGKELYYLINTFLFFSKRNKDVLTNIENISVFEQKLTDLENLSNALLPLLNYNIFGVKPVDGSEKDVLELIDQLNTQYQLQEFIQSTDQQKSIKF